MHSGCRRGRISRAGGSKISKDSREDNRSIRRRRDNRKNTGVQRGGGMVTKKGKKGGNKAHGGDLGT